MDEPETGEVDEHGYDFLFKEIRGAAGDSDTYLGDALKEMNLAPDWKKMQVVDHTTYYRDYYGKYKEEIEAKRFDVLEYIKEHEQFEDNIRKMEHVYWVQYQNFLHEGLGLPQEAPMKLLTIPTWEKTPKKAQQAPEKGVYEQLKSREIDAKTWGLIKTFQRYKKNEKTTSIPSAIYPAPLNLMLDFQKFKLFL